MKYYPMVWILWGSDTQRPWIEEVFAHKIKAEEVLRICKESNSKNHYWIQEMMVEGEQA